MNDRVRKSERKEREEKAGQRSRGEQGGLSVTLPESSEDPVQRGFNRNDGAAAPNTPGHGAEGEEKGRDSLGRDGGHWSRAGPAALLRVSRFIQPHCGDTGHRPAQTTPHSVATLRGCCSGYSAPFPSPLCRGTCAVGRPRPEPTRLDQKPRGLLQKVEPCHVQRSVHRCTRSTAFRGTRHVTAK